MLKTFGKNSANFATSFHRQNAKTTSNTQVINSSILPKILNNNVKYALNLRNEQGDVIQKGQISTDHAKVDDFFGALKRQAARTKGFMAILEVCGFNGWLIKKLED